MTNALHTPAFRRMWAAGLVSDTGDWLLFIAMPLVVYGFTGSAIGTSLAFLMELLPAMLVAPLAARLIARFDRRRLMMVVGTLQGLSLLPLLLVRGEEHLPLVFGVIVAHTSLGALFEPAKNTLLPDIVEPDAVVSANGLSNLGQNLARLVGGPLGGLLLAQGGLFTVVVVDVASYLVAVALVASMRTRTSRVGLLGAREPAGGRARPAGVLAALREPALRSTFAVVVVSSVSQGMFLVLFVLFVLERLGAGEGEVGLLRGIQAVGAIAVAVVLGLLTRTVDSRRLAVGGAAAFGLVSLVTWNLPFLTVALPWYLLLFALVGGPGVALMTGLVTTLQQQSWPEQRGGAFAALGLLSAAGQGIGILLAGLAVSPGSLIALLEIQGVLYLVAAVLGRVLPRPDREVRVDGMADG